VRRTLLSAAAALPLLLPASAIAQTPRVTNGRLVPQAASSGLASTVKTISASQTEPVWIGYTAPARRGDFEMCCGDRKSVV